MPSTELHHKTVKASAVATDKGHFSAIAAAYSVDRMKERIVPGAFGKTIEAWQASQKQIPLHWDHEAAAESIVGWVDPSSMQERGDGLYVEGQLDLKASGMAREAWRSMKNNAVSLSFGYLAKTRKGKNGVTDITEIDLFEISIVPAPANADTRFLSLKGLKETWNESYIDALPDSAFLHIEGEGRHFPYRDEKGAVDLNHLRSALARLPQFDLPQNVKDQLAEKANRILDDASKALQQVEDGSDDEPEKAKSAPQDPLVREAWSLVLPRPASVSPRPEPAPEPEPLDAAEVQREAWGLVLKTRSG